MSKKKSLSKSFYRLENGGIALTLLISVAICMTLFYVSFMFRSLGFYSLQERYKSDVQSFIVQTRAILGDDVTCLEVFKNKTIKEILITHNVQLS